MGSFLWQRKAINQCVGVVVLGASLNLARVVLFYAMPLSAYAAQSIDFSAYNKLQAAYIYKIASLVSWPQGIEASSFTICVLDADGVLSGALRRATSDRTIKNIPISVIRLGVDDLNTSSFSSKDCHMVYINQDVTVAEEEYGPAFEELGRDVLWVASPLVNSPSVSLFDLVLEEDKIVIYINTERMAASHFVVASPLLYFAKPR
ncbi:hypothetical protein Kalk_15860 [Ketobacter alkanivorans]|uniref:DUF4154 domain-containing protein n=1 Tax=Ketobacter alkanivorans TaxID=1917421 RepID=A0A2K9LNF5_9GAMM|nr:hypothetical protein Kalk_15860 [Ketobacter alkanivorans]